jgi:Mlc titration factor MtfA (ptsG expression regulator)
MVLLLLLGVGLVSAGIIFWYPQWRRGRVLQEPVPVAWRDILEQRIALYMWLAPQEREQLLDLMRIFLDQKQFYGCAGLEVRDEMRVVIAAQACLLLLNRRTGVYPQLHHILLYPCAFVHRGEHHNPDGTVSDMAEERLGESWQDGKVILSWDDIEQDLEQPDDGHNVVLHEFAHQLDAETGSDNGTPLLRHNKGSEWVAVMTREYEALGRAAQRGKETFLDPYGATAPAEFFAVLTETFFELPYELEHFHPELFAQLLRYYQTDPRRWYPPET